MRYRANFERVLLLSWHDAPRSHRRKSADWPRPIGLHCETDKRTIIDQATKRLSAFIGTNRPRSFSMLPSSDSPSPASGRSGVHAAQIVVVSSVMFTFISFWRTAAVVLCDMSSTVYYVGAIVENAIGKAAPWFILAVLLFSYMMRAVYIESCALFVRGGVYRIVKEALGGWCAKAAVSALLFDYVLTGPISGVSAGQYIIGLVLETLARVGGMELDDSTRDALKSWGSVAIACRGHAVLPAAESVRHPRVERQSAQDHDRHDRDGRDHARLECGDARRSRAGE